MPVTRSFSVAISPPSHYNLRHAIARRPGHAITARSGGAHTRAAARNLSLPAADPDAGGAAHGPLPAKQGDRGPISLPRPGGGVGRVGLRSEPRQEPRHPVAPDPQSWLDARDWRR